MEENRIFASQLISAYFECCSFIINKRPEFKKSALSAIIDILQEFIHYNLQSKFNMNPYNTIPENLVKLLEKGPSDLQQEILSGLNALQITKKFNYNVLIGALATVQFEDPSFFKEIITNMNII